MAALKSRIQTGARAMPLGFLRRQQRLKEETAVATEQTPQTPSPLAQMGPLHGPAPILDPAGRLEPAGPAPSPLREPSNGIHHLPLKSQATGTDARAERFFRQVRAEVDGLRKQLGEARSPSLELADLDVEAVSADPAAAATLPPEALVRALVKEHRANADLRCKLTRSRAATRKKADALRRLQNERAFERGRLETLDNVIAALHGNLEDLRIARDAEIPRLEGRLEPRVLRPGTGPAHEALPPAESS
jgi:hypothetical protein